MNKIFIVLLLLVLFIPPAFAEDPLYGQVDKNDLLGIRKDALYDAIHKPFKGITYQQVGQAGIIYPQPSKEPVKEYAKIEDVYRKLKEARTEDEQLFWGSLIKSWEGLAGFCDPPPLDLTDIYDRVWVISHYQYADFNQDGVLTPQELRNYTGRRYSSRHQYLINFLLINYDYLAKLTNAEEYGGI